MLRSATCQWTAWRPWRWWRWWRCWCRGWRCPRAQCRGVTPPPGAVRWWWARPGAATRCWWTGARTGGTSTSSVSTPSPWSSMVTRTLYFDIWRSKHHIPACNLNNLHDFLFCTSTKNYMYSVCWFKIHLQVKEKTLFWTYIFLLLALSIKSSW